jgi:hypothetical protein
MLNLLSKYSEAKHMLISTAFLTLAMMADAATKTAQSAVPADPLDKVICRRIIETGSLVKGKRVCLTRREWSRASERGREHAESMQTLINTERGN